MPRCVNQVQGRRHHHLAQPGLRRVAVQRVLDRREWPGHQDRLPQVRPLADSAEKERVRQHGSEGTKKNDDALGKEAARARPR